MLKLMMANEGRRGSMRRKRMSSPSPLTYPLHKDPHRLKCKDCTVLSWRATPPQEGRRACHQQIVCVMMHTIVLLQITFNLGHCKLHIVAASISSTWFASCPFLFESSLYLMGTFIPPGVGVIRGEGKGLLLSALCIYLPLALLLLLLNCPTMNPSSAPN